MPGDRVYLQRGNQWREQLVLEGADGITLGAYGEGAAPVINGSEVITGWQRDGEEEPAVYHASMAEQLCSTTQLYQLLIDGRRAECARQPDTGWLALTARVQCVETNIVPIIYQDRMDPDTRQTNRSVIVVDTNVYDYLDAIELGAASSAVRVGMKIVPTDD